MTSLRPLGEERETCDALLYLGRDWAAQCERERGHDGIHSRTYVWTLHDEEWA